MKRIIASRGTGKSTQLLRMAIENKAVIAAPRVMLHNYKHIALQMGVNVSEIKETEDYVVIKDVAIVPFNSLFSPEIFSSLLRNKEIYIDELEICLERALPNNKIAGYSVSLEDPDFFKIGGKS